MLPGCAPAPKPGNVALKYFDLKAYFNHEAARLAKVHRPINKTVVYNSDSQTKLVTIANWPRELALFAEADINKPSWRDSYAMSINTPSLLVYTATDPDLTTRLISINKVGGTIKVIRIVNKTSNPLYQTEEHLAYYPDSLYRIDKTQTITLLGCNYYLIEGNLR